MTRLPYMTRPRLSMLRILAAADTPLTVVEIAHRASISQTTAHHSLPKMETYGWVEVTPARPRSNEGRRYCITPSARAYIEGAGR